MDPTRRKGKRARLGNHPPPGAAFVWHTRKMLESEAWRALPLNARRFIDFLQIEHMSHAGTENGNLLAPYTQLVSFGLPRSEVSLAIHDAATLGFVAVRHGARLGGRAGASRYALSWLPLADGTPAANGWERITRGDVEAHLEVRRQRLAAKRHRRATKKHKNVPPGPKY